MEALVDTLGKIIAPVTLIFDVMAIISLLIVVVSFFRILFNRYFYYNSGVGSMMVCLLIFGISTGASNLGRRYNKKMGIGAESGSSSASSSVTPSPSGSASESVISTPSASASPSPETTPTPTPTPTPTEQSINTVNNDFSWMPLAWVVGIGLLVLLAIGAFVTLSPLIARRKEEKKRKERKISYLEERRSGLVTKINQLVIDRGTLEMDPAWMFDHPEFSNNTIETVINMNKYHKIAVESSEKIQSININDLTDEMISSCEKDYRNFSLYFDIAKNYAESVGWGTISPEEKKLLSTAKNLLAKASDEMSSDNERSMALQALDKVIDNLRNNHGHTHFNKIKFSAALEKNTGLKMLTV